MILYKCTLNVVNIYIKMIEHGKRSGVFPTITITCMNFRLNTLETLTA